LLRLAIGVVESGLLCDDPSAAAHSRTMSVRAGQAVRHVSTLLRATLFHVEVGMSNRNITLSLPEEDLQRAKIIAVQRGTSLSQLLTRMIKDLADQETGYRHAKARSLALLEEGRDLGTDGQARWSRDDLHER
jgi:hypothetical protein